VETDTQLVPSVVCVMVVHEPGDWFEETLRALAAQDYPNFRTLFLLTPAPAEEIADLTARIRRVLPGAFVREAPVSNGFGPNANEVLRLVEGDNGFFLVCHDDIAPDPRAVRILVAELFRSNAGIVGPKLTEWDDPRMLQHVGLGLDRFGEVDPIVEPGEVDQEQHDAVRDVFVLPSACLLVRADLFRALGGFDPSISFHGDDVDLCWRAHLTGARVVVAPDARVRHREQLAARRPDLSHRTLQARHRMRTVATLTGGSRLLGRSIQLVLVTLVELVVGLFTGRFGEAMASARALVGLLPRTGSILRRRREIRGQRVVPEREVLGLQDRGSSRLTSYLRGKETATFVGADSTVRRWRETSFGPVLAWFCVIVAVIIGSRSFIRYGVPAVGQFLPFPESPAQLLSDYRGSFDPRSFGATAALPTGWAALSFFSVLSLFRMPLLMTMSVVGLYLLGALGAWRLMSGFPESRARIAGMVVYVATPLIPGVLSHGDWTALLWFAALPWLIDLVRRGAGLETADPAAVDLVDGVAPIGLRRRARTVAFTALILALTAAFLPVSIVLFVAAGLVVALATLLVGGSWRVAGWLAACTLLAAFVAFLLNLPWALDWTWADLAGAQPAGASGRSTLDVLSLAPASLRFGVLAVALYVPVVAALAITRAWRLTWSARGAALVVAFGAVMLLADRGALGNAVPRAELLAVPIALGLGLDAAAIAGGFGSDVLSRGFGWRQPVGIIAHAAIVVGIVPAVLAIGDGAWDTPPTPMTTFLASQLPVDPAAGDYRVLYVGDPRVLPVPGREYTPGIAYAVVDAGPLDFTDNFTIPHTPADDAIEEALRLVADGATLRAGRLLAPHGIRYVVVPETDGVHSTADDPIPVPSGLVAALQNQLDIGSISGTPSIEAFVNEAWIPVGAQLSGATAEASRLAGADTLVRSDLANATPTMVGADAWPSATNAVEPGVVHLAIPYDSRLTMTVNGAEVPSRPSFGIETAFDIDAAGTGVLDYERDSARSLWLAVQAVLWIAVLAVGVGAQASFVRRRATDVHDETLIDLTGAPPLTSGVAGEVLAAPAWDDDDGADADDLDGGDEDVDGDDVPEEPTDSEHEPDDTITFQATAGLVAEQTVPSPRRSESALSRGAAPVRDTTPPTGMPRAERATAPDDLDLAGLVASVDDRASGPTSDQAVDELPPPPESGSSKNGSSEIPQP
jgi:GT2 family glycosyltransferase